MANEAAYVAEAEFSVAQRVDIWRVEYQPLACVRFFDHQGKVAQAAGLCLAAERKCSAMRKRLEAHESTGITDRPHGRVSAKQLAKTLAQYGDDARSCRGRMEYVLQEVFKTRANEGGDIAIRNERRFMPLDRVGVLYVMQAMEGATLSTLIVRRAETLFEFGEPTELMLF